LNLTRYFCYTVQHDKQDVYTPPCYLHTASKAFDVMRALVKRYPNAWRIELEPVLPKPDGGF
jgi:hypothetical protein